MSGITCYERDETACDDEMCMRTGCRLTATAPGEQQPVAWHDMLKAGKIMAVCGECKHNNPEGCGHFDLDLLREAPDGSWVCEGCWDDGDDETCWHDLLRIKALRRLENVLSDERGALSRKYCLDKGRCTPIAEAQSSTSPPPAPGIKEAFELFNGIVGSPDASGLVTVKIHKDCLARIHNIASPEALRREAPASSGVGEWTVDDSLLLRKAMSNCGMAGPESIEALGIDFVQYARRVIRIVAERGCPPSRPDAGGDARIENRLDACRGKLSILRETERQKMNAASDRAEAAASIGDMTEVSISSTESERHRQAFSALNAAISEFDKLYPALSTPPAAVESNASVEARLPDWGQIVQILLRCMDATIKNETSREQAERMANELLEKYPALSKPADTPNVSAEARLREALEPFAILATRYDELRKSGECHSWLEFLADFHWPNENQCLAARKALSAAGGEAKKSEGGVEGHAISGTGPASEQSRRPETPTAGIKPGPSDPTADVTVADVKSVLMKTCSQVWAYEAEKMARALLDAFTVGWR